MIANNRQIRKARKKIKYRNMKISLTINKMSTGYAKQAAAYLISGKLTEGQILAEMFLFKWEG